MEDYKCGRIPPCYGGKKFRIHEELEKIKAGDETNDMVYELNKQMCDIGRLISVEEMAERYNKQILQSRLDSLSAWLKLQDMEEKKTIKEWKEAFADLYKAMRKELGVSDLDVKIYQNEVKPIVNFDIHF